MSFATKRALNSSDVVALSDIGPLTYSMPTTAPARLR
jgi:hypothetical protein